jgi:hypothetical protein
MIWHIGSFTSFAVANIIWLTIQAISNSSLDLDDHRVGPILTMVSEGLTVFCVVFAEVPLLHIINTLVYLGLKD